MCNQIGCAAVQGGYPSVLGESSATLPLPDYRRLARHSGNRYRLLFSQVEEADAENATAEHDDKTSPVESGIARQPGTRTDLPVQFHICLKLMIARLRPKTCRFRKAL